MGTTQTFAVEFLHRSKGHWHPKEETRLGATLVDLVFIEKSEDDKVVEQHFVETHTMQKDAREENIVEVEEQLSLEV